MLWLSYTVESYCNGVGVDVGVASVQLFDFAFCFGECLLHSLEGVAECDELIGCSC